MARIVTSFVYPPIPNRNFDWSAVDYSTYDGEGCPIGYGATEQAAIDDLLDKICAARGANCNPPTCAYCDAAIGESCLAIIDRASPNAPDAGGVA